MSNKTHLDDQLLAELLKRTDDEQPKGVTDSSIDEEMVTSFVEGNLTGDERRRVLCYLDNHPQTRQAVSRMMCLAADETEAIDETTDQSPSTIPMLPPVLPWYRRYSVLLAVAASLLIITWIVWPSSGLSEPGVYGKAIAMLREGQFDKVRVAIETARNKGIDSQRLINLQAQAALQIPAEVALSKRGSLTDLGYEIGGVVARAPADDDQVARNKEADRLLSMIKKPDQTIRLNRGYLLLEQARVDEAQEIFRSLAEDYDARPIPWLGWGMAAYTNGDLEQAETAFRHVIQLDPNQVDARINLAMTLTEQGKLKEAATAWLAVPTEKLSKDMKRQITEQVELLLKHMNKSRVP
ncbi:MAG: tetratricopeptide repeat protein [Pirellulales bacterium]|nr:tetratricopeptide repeat protein [Pirellulales bacterium]